MTDVISIILTKSKRSSTKLESDRGSLTDKVPSIAERIIRTLRNILKKPAFEKGNASWISELPSVIKKHNNTIHSSIKMNPNQASKKSNEKEVFLNLKDKREIPKPKVI